LLAGFGLAAALLPQAAAAPLERSFSRSRPVIWISVASAESSRVWAETAVGGWLSDDGGRSFRAPLAASAFRRAQVAQATLLADGRTLLAMPTVWSTRRFSPPRRSSDGGATWEAGKLTGDDARYDFGTQPGFAGETPVTADPSDARSAWFCQGNLYVTHDAGRSWAVAAPHFKPPWHCVALAIARGKAHTLLLLAQATGRNAKRIPGELWRSSDDGATWHAVRAPRYPQLDYNGHALAFDPVEPSTALMIGADGAAPAGLYRSTDAGRSWERVRPAGALRGAVVDQFAFAADGRALALLHIGATRNAAFISLDGGGHWRAAPSPALGASKPAVYASPLAASGSSFLLGTNQRGFWRLAPDARRWEGP
jgi:photosystem II stability/assembly factor-like uncharacterized protein